MPAPWGQRELAKVPSAVSREQFEARVLALALAETER